jgi:glutaminase
VAAKSGVSGGILAAVPGSLGACAFSPPLDPKGNSVAGIKAFERLSCELNLRGF